MTEHASFPAADLAGAVAPGRARRFRRRSRVEAAPGEPRRIAYLYVAPGLLVYAALVVVPFLHTAWFSFFDWDGVGASSWVGLANYRTVFSDAEIRNSFLHTLTLIIFYSVLPVLLGLFLAASLSRMRIRGLAAFRTLLFLPQVVATVVVGVMWRWIYAPNGPWNALLGAVGLDQHGRAWLGDFTWALPSIGLVGLWVSYGLAMVLFIAGLQKIPSSLYDAARVDGAGPVREFFAVTLPNLRNELVVVAVLTIINALHTFDLIYVTTSGGPGESTSVPALELYRNAFQLGHVGLAAAIGITLASFVFVVVFVITRIGERAEPA